MGVYIKGMEMPKKCADCRFCHYEGHDAFCCKALKELVYDDGEVFKPWKKRLKNCPLVPVPPHGRLGDLDEMFLEFVEEGQRSKRYKLGEKWELNGEEIREVISRLPTVIPAEEGET